MSYLSIFPDFDDSVSCERLLALGFTDESWGNDACPSFERDGVAIYVDYADPSLSEWQARDDTRFSVINGARDESFSFDDLEHAIAHHAHLTAEA
tara:strand:+ start:170 stop:454 length:285 start_codon:yes stop_codon:yes gene_type:complete